jgi:phosphoglycerate dehydrogenase-like enzyme
VKFVIRSLHDPRRLEFITRRLDPPWQVQVMPAGHDMQQLGRALADAQAVLSMNWTAAFPPAPALRLMHLPGAGLDEVDLAAVPPGAAVCNVYEHEIGIAEYLLLGMLEWEIRLARMDRSLREGLWRGSFVDGAPLHGELFGKTVGFVGYGRIARETARRAVAFGMQVLACSRTPGAGDGLVEAVQEMSALHAMLRHCDYAVVSCPLTEATRGVIDIAALDALGPQGVILNVGRGPVIDEEALWQALSTGRIAGAVIDTWYRYPESGRTEPCHPSSFPIHTLDNVIMSPHASGWSAGLQDRRWGVITDNLNRLAAGEALRNQVRAPRG